MGLGSNLPKAIAIMEQAPYLENPDDRERRAAQRLAQRLYARRACWISVVLLAIVSSIVAWQQLAPWQFAAHPIRLTDVMVGVDPNTASWAELALLPGVGESVAKRIVAYRDTRIAQLASGAIVFAKPVDLLPVKGIGQRILLKIQDSLRFPPLSPRQFDSVSDGD